RAHALRMLSPPKSNTDPINPNLPEEGQIYLPAKGSNICAFLQLSGQTSYAYDPNGSLISKTNATNGTNETFSYNARNQLATATIQRTENGHAVNISSSYAYNHAGIRVRSDSTVNGATQSRNFLVDSFNHTGYAQVLEESNNGSLAKSYVLGDDVLSQSVNGIVSYLLYDGHGSTRLLSDANSAITARYDFDAYGIMIGGNPSVSNPAATDMLYSGEQFDFELQQQYLRDRIYDQNTGRFGAIDAVVESRNGSAYLYCFDNPVNKIDPSGRWGRDVHVYFTYYIAREWMGMSDQEASELSWACQEVDDNYETKPIKYWYAGDAATILATNDSVLRLHKFHIPNAPGKNVEAGDAEIRDEMIKTKNSKNIIRFGILLHIYQDTFAHAGFSALSGMGHMWKGSSPDSIVDNIRGYDAMKADLAKRFNHEADLGDMLFNNAMFGGEGPVNDFLSDKYGSGYGSYGGGASRFELEIGTIPSWHNFDKSSEAHGVFRTGAGHAVSGAAWGYSVIGAVGSAIWSITQ
ncbi:MAG: DUF6765 family protein, partial [Victivallales bacterium]